MRGFFIIKYGFIQIIKYTRIIQIKLRTYGKYTQIDMDRISCWLLVIYQATRVIVLSGCRLTSHGQAVGRLEGNSFSEK